MKQVNPAAVAALARKLILDDVHSDPMPEVIAVAEGREVVIRARTIIEGHDQWFATRVPVPETVGDPLWRYFAEDSVDLYYWVLDAIQILFVEAVEAGGLSYGTFDADGTCWVNIWR